MTKRRQRLDVPDGYNIVAWTFGNLDATLRQRVEYYEAAQVHLWEKALLNQ